MLDYCLIGQNGRLVLNFVSDLKPSLFWR